MTRTGWRWTLLAALVGFLTSFVLTSLLHLPRSLFVAVHVGVVTAFVIAFARVYQLSLRGQLERRWIAGVIGGIVVGLLLVRQVLSQPSSASAEGGWLVLELALYGVAYGIADALLLTVVPVVALYGARPSSELERAGARVAWGLVALIGSAVVTAAYHAGFAEFRGAQLVQPVIGNTLITLAYLATGNPLAALISHVLMHAAAVMHGLAATMQLPPHY
jgi:hypothetical protein